MKLKDPDKIDLIYKATLKLVKQNGLTGLNMAAIGKEAKLGMGTIYVYFKSKEELINSLFRKLKRANLERIFGGMSNNAPFKLNMKELFESYVTNRYDYYEEHLFIEQCINSHFLDKESKKLDEAAYEGLYELIDRGKKEMLVKKLDNHILAAHLVGSCNELVNMCVRNKMKITKTILDQSFGMSWDSIQN